MKSLMLAICLSMVSVAAFAQTHDEQVSGLTQAGFTEIGNGIYMKIGDGQYGKDQITVVFNEDGSFRLYDGAQEQDEIQAIRVGTMFGVPDSLGQVLINHLPWDHVQYIVGETDHQSGPLSNKDEKAYLLKSVGQPLAQQLEAAKFESVNGSPNVFRRSFHNRETMFILSSGDKDAKVIARAWPMDDDFQRKAAGKKITGYKLIKQGLDIDGFVSALIVEDDKVRYQLSTRYDNETTLLKNFSEYTVADVGGQLPTEKSVNGEGFNMGGKNTNLQISKVKSIGGVAVDDIELRARASAQCAILPPFLGEKESLLKSMAQDNKTISAMGLTHQQIATPLLKILALYGPYMTVNLKQGGNVLKINDAGRVKCLGLDRKSPFTDADEGNNRLIVTNTVTGKTITFNAIQAQMIYNYGFYGSHEKDLAYLDPKTIIEFFGLKHN